jgi:hypothetical protein
MAGLIPESIRKHFDQNGSAFPFPRQQSARKGQAAVRLPAIPARRRSDLLTSDCKKALRGDFPQVRILCNLARACTRPL